MTLESISIDSRTTRWSVASARRLLSLCLCAWGAMSLMTCELQAKGERAAVLEQHTSAIVRVEVVLSNKMNMGGQGQEEESRIEIFGAVVDPGGLIMLWNSNISSTRINEMLQDMGQADGFKFEITPTSLVVHLGTEEREAFLAATDSSLDLAFIQLEESPAKPLPFVDFSQAVTPSLGAEIVQVSRMGRGFDDASRVTSARVGGMIAKPRRAWIVDGELDSFGLPVFDLEGRPVGALTTIFSRSGDSSGSMAMSPMMSALSSGSPFESLQPFVLPGERVATLVRLAKERAVELAGRRSTGASGSEGARKDGVEVMPPTEEVDSSEECPEVPEGDEAEAGEPPADG
ncbi:MAG: serine protease [Thermoanaerobaculia bacterium]|nr:serine protease [Thermoanaerobaculia bacterium]